MNKLISIYINNGVSLFEQGENTVIIPIELSNDIIDILENLNFFILGGDLYRKNDNNEFEHTYDNWYYEGNIQSDSIAKTRKYLDNFKNNQNLYVSFVFK
ncbi:MAG: hypothetical protein ACTTJV_08370 [Ottowia sp.]